MSIPANELYMFKYLESQLILKLIYTIKYRLQSRDIFPQNLHLSSSFFWQAFFLPKWNKNWMIL